MGVIKSSPRGTHSTLLVVSVTFIVTCRYLYFKTISTPTPAAMKLKKPHTMSEATILPYQVSSLAEDFNVWPNASSEDFISTNRMLKQLRLIHQVSRINKNKTARSNKVILLQSEFFHAKWVRAVTKDFENRMCPINECLFTIDAGKYHETADAIVMYFMDKTRLQKILPKPAHQIWIAFENESPYQSRIDTSVIGSYINWSISYRLDSHIPDTYDSFQPLPSSKKTTQTTVNYAAGKTKHVAWMVTNCNGINGRSNYANELGRYINVDIYGRCGISNVSCSSSNFTRDYACMGNLFRQHRFYLAFENSNCHYYISEKPFDNAYRLNMIPIVMGARSKDYASLLLPHSYIHVDDFSSPRHLADYLHTLSVNDTAYNEYFWWKSSWTIGKRDKLFCRLCGMLHVASEQRYVHWYDDYGLWWKGEQNSVCGSNWTEVNGVKWQTWRTED